MLVKPAFMSPARHHVVRSKPRLGQNFLVDLAASARIVAAMGDLSGAATVEIGPGRGILTRLLAKESRSLTAVEIDHELADGLKQQFAENPSVRILRQDILQVDLTALAAEKGSRLRIAGNLPYYLTSEILLHLFHHVDAIECAVIMVQREVAARLAAHPGIREYGLLSATAQMHAAVESLFSLPPAAFRPPPEVHSTVVRLRMAPRFEELGVGREAFSGFLRKCFLMKRKTLVNNLLAAGFPRQAISDAFEACRISPGIRAESVGLDGLACLSRSLQA